MAKGERGRKRGWGEGGKDQAKEGGRYAERERGRERKRGEGVTGRQVDRQKKQDVCCVHIVYMLRACCAYVLCMVCVCWPSVRPYI